MFMQYIKGLKGIGILEASSLPHAKQGPKGEQMGCKTDFAYFLYNIEPGNSL